MNAQDNFNDAELRGGDAAEAPAAAPSAAPLAVANPFGVAKPIAAASAESDVARAVTEVQAGMLIARQFPRNELAAMDKILNAFARPGLAEKAVYQYARGGSDIVGPSIRAAEALAQLWGNIYTGVRELEQRGGASTVEAFAWDTETGFHDVKVFQVTHMRHTRSGSYKIEDPRDIYEHVANAAARRKRACILAVIPSDVIDAAMRQADLTMHTKAEATPEVIANLVAAFGAFGVSREAIEKKIQRRMDAITPAQIVQMRRIYNSLRDGMSSVVDWFEVDATPPTPTGAAAPSAKPAKGTDGLKAAKAKADAKTAGTGQTVNLSGAHIDPTTSASGGGGGSARDAGVPAPVKSATDPGGASVTPGEPFMVAVDGGGPAAHDVDHVPPKGIAGGPGPTGPAPVDMMPAPALADALEAIKRAGDHDTLDLMLDAARMFTDPQQVAEIDVAGRARRKALGER